MQGLVSGLFVGVAGCPRPPEAAPVAADIPVRQVVNEPGRFLEESRGVVGRQLGMRHVDERLQIRQHPAIDLGTLGDRDRPGVRVEPIEPGVIDEECVGVPQGNQHLPTDVIGGGAGDQARGEPFGGLGDRTVHCFECDSLAWVPAAKPQIGGGVLRQVEPAQRIDPQLLGGFFEPDGGAVRLVHRFAIFIHHQPMPQQRLERGAPVHHGGHREQGVEPVAELAGEALGDHIGGIPLAPRFPIRVVLQRREGNDPGIEPRIPHVGNAGHQVPRAGIADLDLVDPWAVRGVTRELVPALHRPLAQFGE